MRLLYLIRHASPVVQPGTPAETWPLSERGIEEAGQMGEVAAPWGLQAIYSSREAKAMSTALALAGGAGTLQVHTVEGLHELHLAYLANADDFSETVREILASPDVSVRGAEPAAAAAERFAGAISIVRDGAFPAAVVSHGRVLTAYLSAAGRSDEPFALWRAMPMPGWLALDLDASPRPLERGFEGLPAS